MVTTQIGGGISQHRGVGVRVILPGLAVPRKPLEPGLAESDSSGLADGLAAALMLVVGGHIADGLVHPVVVLASEGQLGA